MNCASNSFFFNLKLYSCYATLLKLPDSAAVAIEPNVSVQISYDLLQFGYLVFIVFFITCLNSAFSPPLRLRPCFRNGQMPCPKIPEYLLIGFF